MSKRGINRQDFQGVSDGAYSYLASLADAPSEKDLEPLESIDATSTAAQIGAAIASYVANVKG